MEKLYFMSDYTEGAHEKILERLIETNRVSVSGYGADPYCRSAADKIRKACDAPDAAVYFLTGGTQSNQVVIDTLSRPYEGVICASSGHINTHEAGAVEMTGHKVLALPHHEGRIDPGELRAYLDAFFGDPNWEHMVIPGIVYVTHPTEYGTLYTRDELAEIAEICRERGLKLYLDGARLAYGLVAPGTDVDLPFIAKVTDAFYIGGTKAGAFLGEAVVFPRGDEPPHFMTQMKRHGALMAKGRLAGISFDTLFTDGLYEAIGHHAVTLAMSLREGLAEKGVPLFLESPTNQQFFVLENDKLADLSEKVGFEIWESVDDKHTAIRLVTSWATTREMVEALIDLF